jgi:hypothetical protein
MVSLLELLITTSNRIGTSWRGRHNGIVERLRIVAVRLADIPAEIRTGQQRLNVLIPGVSRFRGPQLYKIELNL